MMQNTVSSIVQSRSSRESCKRRFECLSGYAYDEKKVPAVNFLNAIEWHFEQGNPCVVLIDEYDDPVARALANPAEAEQIREELAGFYGKIKDRTHMIRFLMITGVSKFTKMSVFSALSNLTDITFEAEYAAISRRKRRATRVM